EHWRVAPVTKITSHDGSDYCALRRFMWRVSHIHKFIPRVAQEVGRVARARNIYKEKSFSDPGLAG
ncbi:hypothetical protein A2U01_0073489, partial [Trifolium medium]|nr:hypothetical protein [Trifolium medium]